MSYCVRIEEYNGTKSQKIIGMINFKQRERLTKRLPSLIKNKALIGIKKRYDKAELTFNKLKEQKTKIEEKLGLEWCSYDKTYGVLSKCFVLKEDYENLQKAQNLYSLGKIKQAKEIWNSIIEKHNLF